MINNAVTGDRAEQVIKETNEGIIGKTIRAIISVVLWLGFALMINIISELSGMAFKWWDIPGSKHSEMMIQKELTWLNTDFKNAIGNPYSRAKKAVDDSYEKVFVWKNKDYGTSITNLSKGRTRISVYFKAMFNMVELFIIRLVVIVFSFPVFIIFGFLAVIDGLVERDKRRFGGGRESSYFWHYVSSWIKPLMIAPFVIYIASPFSIHPSLVMIPFAVSFGYTLWLSTSMFKKYL